MLSKIAFALAPFLMAIQFSGGTAASANATATDGYPAISGPQASALITAQAQQDAATYATQSALASAQSPIGVFTLATLPTCTGTLNGKLAYATDLGGGSNNVKCINGAWQHLTLGVPQTNTSNGAVTVTPLASAPIQLLAPTGGYALGAAINISGNLYPGEPFYFVTPNTLGGTVASLGVSVNGVSTGYSLLPGKTYFFVANASGQLVQIQ